MGNTGTDIYLYDTCTTSSSSTWYITWWDGTGWQNSTVDPLEQMRDQFQALKDKFFEEREAREIDEGHIPFGKSRTSRKGRECMLRDLMGPNHALFQGPR